MQTIKTDKKFIGGQIHLQNYSFLQLPQHFVTKIKTNFFPKFSTAYFSSFFGTSPNHKTIRKLQITLNFQVH